jgi:glycosyltransferase involved in cell wall biosynthesis
MDQGLNIVCMAFPAWEGDYMKSTVQLMKELAVKNRVLYVDYAFSLKDIFINSRHNKFIPVKHILNPFNCLRTVNLENGGQITVVSLPPVFPINWCKAGKLYDTIHGINQWLVKNRIRRAMRILKMQSPMLVNAFNPAYGFKFKAWLGAKSLVYYCYDNISAAVWAAKHGTAQEQELLEKADTLIFSSEALKTEKTPKGKTAYVVNNGVDLTLFEEAMQSPREAIGTQKNIVYTGSVDNRLDYDLLEQIISHNKCFRFHFIGRINTDQVERLKALENVELYGAVTLSELPNLMKNMDAGIIPFVKDDFTKNIYPMKVHEYLALGLPVIMTDFADLSDLTEMVDIAYNTIQFNHKLTTAVQNDSAELKAKRVQMAISNSWRKKGEAFEKILRANA